MGRGGHLAPAERDHQDTGGDNRGQAACALMRQQIRKQGQVHGTAQDAVRVLRAPRIYDKIVVPE